MEPERRETTEVKEGEADHNWKKVANFILQVKGGEFQKKLKKFKEMKQEEERQLRLKHEREQQEKEQAAQIRQRGLVKLKEKPMRFVRNPSIYKLEDRVQS